MDHRIRLPARPGRRRPYATDVTERRHAEGQLRIAAKVFDQGGEGIMITDADERIIMVNQAFTRIAGYTADEARGQTLRLLASERHDSHFFRHMHESIDTRGYWQGEIWNRTRDGEVVPYFMSISRVTDERGRPAEYIATLADISRQKADQAHIHRLAYDDPLTDLPNRALVTDRISAALKAAHRAGHRLALAFMDLDKFKSESLCS